jgi:two-component system sensor histidine kinase UhpB
VRDEDKTKEQLLEELRTLRAILARTEKEPSLDRPGLPIERLPLAYIRFDADIRVLDWNLAAQKIFGYTREEVLGRVLLDLILDLPLTESLQRVLERIRAGDMNAHSVNENRTKDGRVITCQWFNTPLLDPEGRFIGAISLGQDITERGRVETMLEQNRRRLQAIFENVLDPILLMDDSGRYVDGNPACCELLGYSREELLQLTLWGITPEELRTCIPELGGRLLSEGRLSGEYTLLCKGGANRVVEFRSVANILPGLHLAIYRDITERKRAEEELRRLNVALENAVEGIALLDRQGRYLSVNPAYARMTGHRPDQLAGRSWQRTVHPDDLQEVETAHQIMLREGRAEAEVRGVRRDQTLFWKQIVMVKPREQDGQWSGHYCFMKDITERKQVEGALRESEERFRNAFDHAPVGMFLTGLDGRWLKVNEALCQTVGYSEEELLATTWEAITHPEDLEPDMARVRGLLAGEAAYYHLEKRYLHKDGRVAWILLGASLVRDQHGRPLYFVGHAQDITERKGAEGRLRDYSDRVQALSRRLLGAQEDERRHLARELHDEFGQLLAAINFQLHAAKWLAGAAAQSRLDECSTLLQQAGEQVRSLALELRPTMLDTLGLEAALRWLAERHQQRTGAEVWVEACLSGPPLSPDLAIACFRVAQEALTNVVRHAQARHVWMELRQGESALELVVRDDGVGFAVAPAQEHAARRGSLGLLGMRERVKALGGTLDLESEPGRGTRVCATVPLNEISQGRAAEAE